ncbi:MAG: hypothetical protein INQ03_02360 [Candidatus Heimdallarchaeota archaeon]|nr:hypothetical protein [Candidatus Heimdallarchaeota archaeon]
MKTCEFLEGNTTCGMTNSSFCTACGIPICDRHAIATSDGIMCMNCATKANQSVDSATPIIEYPEGENDAFWDQMS